MKKTVIIILAILPIFLVFTISFAARILSLTRHIPVEKVAFVDEDNTPYPKDHLIEINIGEQFQTTIVITPEYASNKKVEYTSSNTAVCTIDENGIITGLSCGTSIIMVKTEEGSKYSIFHINVTQKNVTGVSLPFDELELNIGETKILSATVIPDSASNRMVYFSSSNPDIVSVDKTGNIKALKEGQATITVMTDDGNFTDTCLIIVKDGTPALYFDFTSDARIIKTDDVYLSNIGEFNLLNYLQIDKERVIMEEVKFNMKSGQGIATLKGGILTITGISGPVIWIEAYVGDQDKPTYYTDFEMIVLQ